MANRSYTIGDTCVINGSLFTAIEVTESAAKHHRDYFQAKGKTDFEKALEAAVRYLVSTLNGKTLMADSDDTTAYTVRYAEHGEAVAPTVTAKYTNVFTRYSACVIGLESHSQLPFRETKLHLYPDEGMVLIYHLLETRKSMARKYPEGPSTY